LCNNAKLRDETASADDEQQLNGYRPLADAWAARLGMSLDALPPTVVSVMLVYSSRLGDDARLRAWWTAMHERAVAVESPDELRRVELRFARNL
jgi:hypothetical protein